MVRADEAAGICAKPGAAGTTRTANKAKGAIERGKLADINTPLVLVRSLERLRKSRRQHSRNARDLPAPLSLSNECPSKGSQTSPEVTTRFFRVSNNPTKKRQRNGELFHQFQGLKMRVIGDRLR
jgi:hypothetical protein